MSRELITNIILFYGVLNTLITIARQIRRFPGLLLVESM